MTPEQEKIWNLLTRRSRLCMRRKFGAKGRKYYYKPRSHLLNRLAKELNCSKEEARDKLQKLRKFILANRQYFPA